MTRLITLAFIFLCGIFFNSIGQALAWGGDAIAPWPPSHSSCCLPKKLQL
jgi:hypothetical protein